MTATVGTEERSIRRRCSGNQDSPTADARRPAAVATSTVVRTGLIGEDGLPHQVLAFGCAERPPSCGPVLLGRLHRPTPGPQWPLTW